MRTLVQRTFWRVWRVPLLLAVLTVFGLLAALLGTGAWHVVAWIALAIPIGVAARFAMKP
jgi:hypothetical protein